MRIKDLGYQWFGETKRQFDMLIRSINDNYTTPVINNSVPGQQLPCTDRDSEQCINYAKYNGVYGYFGYVTMSTGSRFDLEFTIVKSGTEEPMPLDKFYFTFFDLDTGDPDGDQSGSAEICSATGYEKYMLGPNSELKVEKDSKGVTTFRATTYGTGADNPTDPLLLTEQQQNRAVTFMYLKTAKFVVSYEVGEGRSIGRDVYFAGKSQLATNPCFNDGGTEAPGFAHTPAPTEASGFAQVGERNSKGHAGHLSLEDLPPSPEDMQKFPRSHPSPEDAKGPSKH
jgi:hypothetical protein